ncbi:hypothetical protein SAMN05421858_4771 [Haladaptatus litoreus]|uniref:Uncharacterized protein n=1 Tax=Haladaptatus litoreus TaxID=553468 RepID=A0A1N7F3R6_9EURY|nr:hypothetical protein [Haladaptatus litoreus]SIR94892.1 hypothetical protein SAMN05421858_4771 [Haladaptatus litoreus]
MILILCSRAYSPIRIHQIITRGLNFPCFNHPFHEALPPTDALAAVENAIDDGTLDAFPSEDDNDTEPDNCDCDGLGDFPCWPCVRAGQKELPD